MVSPRLGRRRYRALRAEMNVNALVIQRCYRGFVARDARNERLYARESEERDELLHMLAAEETYYDGKVELLERRFAAPAAGGGNKFGGAMHKRKAPVEKVILVLDELDYLVSDVDRICTQYLVRGAHTEALEKHRSGFGHKHFWGEEAPDPSGTRFALMIRRLRSSAHHMREALAHLHFVFHPQRVRHNM